MPLLLPYKGVYPIIHETAWIAPNATVIGDVRIGPRASVWFGAVLRGDLDRIEMGAGSNFQDNVVVHTQYGIPTLVGENVGVGHLAIIHGATIEDGCLIGMGAKLLNESHVGAGALVAAGSVVREGQRVAAGRIVAGVPAKDRGPLTAEQAERVHRNAYRYHDLSAEYRAAGI
jgi:carbonic anhydrase/acetyltransferase-like protein (isoleucine patch superfamily)